METFNTNIFDTLETLEAYIKMLIEYRDGLCGETQGEEKGLVTRQIILLSEMSMLDFDGNDPIYYN